MLRTRTQHPPGGFQYRERSPLHRWKAPDPLLPFNMIVDQIQALRLANPNAGLSPEWSACADNLDEYNCARLHNDPAWCASERAAVIVPDPARGRKLVAGCAACGKRRGR